MTYKVIEHKQDLCDYCGNEIKIQIFRGTDHCSENCRKLLEGKKDPIVRNIRFIPPNTSTKEVP